MSSINYNNNNTNNQIPLQDPNAPPRLVRNISPRGGVLGRNNDYMGRNNNYLGRNNDYIGRNNNYIGRNKNYLWRDNNYFRQGRQGNQFYYQNRGNQFYNQNGGNRFNYRRYPRNYYRRNIFYNRNYRIPRQYFNPYETGGYGFVNPRQQRQGRSVQPVRSPSRRRPSNRPRRRGPRQIRLNDFMPTELREPSPNLPPEFNIAPTTAPNAPQNALPQRERFAQRNTTQPFTVTENNQNQQLQQQQQNQRQRKTTSSFRRRQRRNNRFAVLADDNENDNVSDVEVEVKDEPIFLNTNKRSKKDKKNKKLRRYLEPNRILKWLEDHSRSSKNAISSRGNQAYVLASTPIYDEWVRNNYELQVWQTYLKMGTEQKHWAKEVVRRTKRRDDVINIRFVQKKINRLTTSIAEVCASISDLQIQLSTYWMQTISENTNQRLAQATATLVAKQLSVDRARQTTAAGNVGTDTDDELDTGTTGTAGAAPTTTTTTVKNYVREPVERIEKYILEYIHFCTQHVKKMAQGRIQLAKAQMEEFKALEDFEQIATPTQWNTHFLLKPKMKLWSTKNKNYQILSKRVELDMPPKIIDKVDFSFKIDESIVSQDEAQVMYNQMRQITKDFRTQAMTLYVQSAARENEILSNEIKGIIERFPNENDDGFDAEPGFAAFKQYHELREKRMKLEIEQSLYFLFEQRVESEVNNPEEEEIVAPTLIRSLGEDFLLQQ
ncbi:unnamed protein product [Rotaria sordida]|uniref:Uncharacterized protein n=1 Tax=Rotaria sordida TaxID=392033 RepID=A0A814X6V0_9BILA|nr:unnamed protein product [Rotaria sordida]